MQFTPTQAAGGFSPHQHPLPPTLRCGARAEEPALRACSHPRSATRPHFESSCSNRHHDIWSGRMSDPYSMGLERPESARARQLRRRMRAMAASPDGLPAGSAPAAVASAASKLEDALQVGQLFLDAHHGTQDGVLQWARRVRSALASIFGPEARLVKDVDLIVKAAQFTGLLRAQLTQTLDEAAAVHSYLTCQAPSTLSAPVPRGRPSPMRAHPRASRSPQQPGRPAPLPPGSPTHDRRARNSTSSLPPAPSLLRANAWRPAKASPPVAADGRERDPRAPTNPPARQAPGVALACANAPAWLAPPRNLPALVGPPGRLTHRLFKSLRYAAAPVGTAPSRPPTAPPGKGTGRHCPQARGTAPPSASATLHSLKTGETGEPPATASPSLAPKASLRHGHAAAPNIRSPRWPKSLLAAPPPAQPSGLLPSEARTAAPAPQTKRASLPTSRSTGRPVGKSGRLALG